MLRAWSIADTQVCYAGDLFTPASQALDSPVWWPSPVRYLQSRSSAVPFGEAQTRVRMGDHQPLAPSLKQSHGNSCELGLRPQYPCARRKNAGKDFEACAEISHGRRSSATHSSEPGTRSHNRYSRDNGWPADW